MNNDILYGVILDMRATEKLMPASQYVVSDQDIISRIEKIDDINIKDNYGRTLLINAASFARKEVVQYLLKRGSDIHVKDNEGFTALHAGVIANDVEIVTLLLDAGADVNARNIYGNSPMLVCNLETDLNIFTTLLAYGADADQLSESGFSSRDIFSCSASISKVLKRK